MKSNIKFGTDGWRSLLADQFTFANIEIVIKSILGYIQEVYSSELPIIVSYDTRFMSKQFADFTANIIQSYGYNVLLTDRDTPTPVVAFCAKHFTTAGGIIFTASHNPAEYNGIKYIPDYAGPATDKITNIIMQNVNKIKQGDEKFLKKTNNTGIRTILDPKPVYFDAVRKLINFEIIRQKSLNVIYDPMYSSARGYLDELLIEAGCNVTVIRNWPDPLYGGGQPDPKIEFLVDLTKMVKVDKLAIGFATDGDGDRFGVLDENANYIMPDKIIAILLEHLYNNKKLEGSIVRSIATTHMLDKLAEKYNLKLHETPVGFKYIGEIMRKEQVLIGGEESGGLSIIGHIPEKDGIVACLSIVEALAYTNKTLSQLQEGLFKIIDNEYFYDRIDLHVSDFIKSRFVKYLANTPPDRIAGMKVKEISTVDGAKLYLEDQSWILTRPSGTEPLLRIYFETNSLENLSKMIKEMKKVIENLEKLEKSEFELKDFEKNYH